MSKKYMCRECIYFPKCDSYGWQDGDSEICEDFKNKSLFVELPCNVGDKIYQIDTTGNIYESEITKIIYDTHGIAFDEKAIGKSVFLSLKECELALAERTD